VVGGVSVGVVGLLASVLAVASVLEASDGRSAGLSAAMGPPSRSAVMRCGQIQLDAYVSNRGEPVKRDLGMRSPVRSVSGGRKAPILLGCPLLRFDLEHTNDHHVPP
jgi:hypothetical protein